MTKFQKWFLGNMTIVLVVMAILAIPANGSTIATFPNVHSLEMSENGRYAYAIVELDNGAQVAPTFVLDNGAIVFDELLDACEFDNVPCSESGNILTDEQKASINLAIDTVLAGANGDTPPVTRDTMGGLSPDNVYNLARQMGLHMKNSEFPGGIFYALEFDADLNASVFVETNFPNGGFYLTFVDGHWTNVYGSSDLATLAQSTINSGSFVTTNVYRVDEFLSWLTGIHNLQSTKIQRSYTPMIAN